METQAPKSETPPCAAWDVWVGGEIEGHVSKGVSTLFIRSLAKFPKMRPTDNFAYLREKSKCSRVWFCKEFTNWALVKAIGKFFEEVCIEVEADKLLTLPLSLRKTARLYLKVDLPEELKAGDHVCVGVRFKDESFMVGTGVKVNPEMYCNDRKIV